MAFSLYIDGSCASTSCTYVEYSGGYLQWNDADGGSDYVGTIYRDNVSKEFTYSGPDDLYLTTTYNPGSGGGTPGSGGGTGGDDTPMVVTFNYYVDGKLVDDTTFKAIEMDMGRPIDEIWPRTLECYHIRFDKINPVEDINPGISGSTEYNSLEFTYIDEQKFNVIGDSWPVAGALNHPKVLQAFSHTYFSENKCVIINGTGYEAGESFTKKPTFHSNTTKSIEVNLYYTTVIVSTKVYSYNADNNTYVDSDLWGYVSVRLDSRVPSSVAFVTTSGVVEYATLLTGTHAIYCKAIAKPGFVFSKWVYNSSINSIDNYENLTEKERRNAVLALPAVETLDGSLPNTEIKIDAYKSNEITAVFKGLKNEVKLYKGLDFSGADTYYIYGGDKQWKNGINSNIDIKMLLREGATLIGWVYYSISNNYPTFTRTQYNTIVAALLNKNDYASPIDIAEELVRHINTDPTKSAKLIIPIISDGSEITPVLLPNKTGYTDSQGNWLTDNKVLYPLWVLDEYNITYKSHGEETLIVDETAIDPDDGRTYELVPSAYDLPEKYTIADDNTFKKLTEKSVGTFPQYYSFDKWEPSEIKPFTKTGDQTITAYWILDTYKITLEKNNNYPNQSIKIKAGKSTFVNDEEIHNPTTRTAYKSFEGWYTENDVNTTNGTGILIIDKDGKLQSGVEGFTDSEGRWIKKENTTVYAKWTPEEYTITYIIDGEDEHITRKYTIEDTKPNWYNLLSDPFGNLAPEGHYLDGWYTNENYSGSRVSVLENGTTGDKTFYGRCKPFEYDIEYYNIDDCTNTEDLPDKHTYGIETELEEPVFSLHDFKGWYTDENFENLITSIPSNYTISAGGTGFGTIKLYAKKALKLIPIYYRDSKGNDLAETSFNSKPPVSYDYENGTQLVEAHKNWYTFDGWYDNIECDGNSFMSLGAKEYTDIIILYCKFIPIEKTIKYYVDGVEKTVDGNPSKYTVEDLNPYITLKNPQDKPGYNSIGWRKNSPSSTVVLNKIASVEDLNLYWVWEPNVVTITWDANRGTVSQTSSTYTYNGDPVQLPSPTREGYTFDGWYTSPTGGTKITDIGVNNKPTEDITYYALWHHNAEAKCTLIHKRQALDGTYPESLYDTYELFLMVGHNITFGVQEYTGFTSPPKQSAIIAADGSTVVEYYYTRNKYTISWNANGGEELTGDYTNGSVYFETRIVKPNDPIKSEYTFTGWDPSVPEIMPASDITFTASYEYAILDITPIAVDFNLETVEPDKIATNKWLHNVLGEPEKTSWGDLSNIFKTGFGSNITGECVTVADLRYFITTQSTYECKKQTETLTIFSNSNISSELKQNKLYTLSKITSNANYIDFKVTPNESTINIPNYPGTDGFIMYFSVGSNTQIYKATIPVNRICRLEIRTTSTSDAIIIHRIPCYYGNSTYKIIVPIIGITNNGSNIHKLYSNTALLQQVLTL